ncbi:MAG: hypothetical protein V1874_15570 [Spirochaetota bacterium]
MKTLIKTTILLLGISFSSCWNMFNDTIDDLGKTVSPESITAFSIEEPTSGVPVNGIISGVNITVSLPEGVSLTNLIATFTHTGTELRIGSTVQVSGVTANNFATSQLYILYDSNGLTKNYMVNVRTKSWTAKTSGLPVSGTEWSSITSSSDGNRLAAAISSYGDGIYVSANGGTDWTHLTTISGVSRSIASLADGTCLSIAAGWGDMDPDYVYTSLDSGLSWTTHNAAVGGSNEWSSIASSSDGTYVIAAQSRNTDGDGYIYIGEYDGDTWAWDQTQPAILSWKGVASSSTGLYMVAVADGGNIYTSVNGGSNWTSRESVRAWSSVASSSNGTILYATVYGGQIYRSINSGVNWTSINASNQNWKSIACSSDGTTVVAAVEGGTIVSSINSGTNWISHSSAGSHDWRSVTMPADGSRFAAVAYNERYVYIYD